MRPDGKAKGMALSRSCVPSEGKRVISPKGDQEAPELVDEETRKTRSDPEVLAKPAMMREVSGRPSVGE